MGPSTERPIIPAARTLSVPLAGLQAGMLAALWMLAWMGATSVWQRRSFWTPENLLATAFYRHAALSDRFSGQTLSGLALYLLIYSSLGLIFATVVRLRLHPGRLVVVGILAGLGWYFLSFHLLWKAANPLIPLLHAERPTLLGHVLYGAMVARFPRHVAYSPGPATIPEALVSHDS